MAEERRILLIDGNGAHIGRLRRVLASGGYQAYTATSLQEALAFLHEHAIDLVIFDPAVSADGSLSFVRHLFENHGNTAVIVTTENPSVEVVVASIKLGADDYLRKPMSAERLLNAVRAGLRKVARRRRLALGPLGEGAGLKWGLIGDSPAIRALCARISTVAHNDATVLIHGETGTGKELVARAIHQESRRSSAPFLPVSGAELAAGMLESELFGHVRGAFTNAERNRKGLFRAAHRGTLFLDEIGEMPANLQAKLLRVLESGLVRPIGTTRDYRVDVRVVVATHRDLEEQVTEGRFRQDLFFRINTFEMEVPPLRDRGDDILLLMHHFLGRSTEGLDTPRLSDDVIERLLTYDWPGNVRELISLAQQVAVVPDGREFDVTDLPERMRFRSRASSSLVDRTLAEVEEEHIRRMFDAKQGNQSATAKSLGISRESLRPKLRRFGLIK